MNLRVDFFVQSIIIIWIDKHSNKNAFIVFDPSWFLYKHTHTHTHKPRLDTHPQTQIDHIGKPGMLDREANKQTKKKFCVESEKDGGSGEWKQK